MNGSAETAVQVRGVRKAFGDHLVYDGLDLDVRKGEVLTVLGPSGSGKSVLLRLIVGLMRPDAGRILVDGVEVTALDERRLREVRRRVGMLFQGAALFDSLSIGENVAYGLQEHFDWPRVKVDARVSECLGWVGMPSTEEMRPADLSGGMKKRVGLARALAPGPDIILYDEPTTGLDPANTRRICELIVSLQRRLGVTSMVITHDLEAAFQVTDRIALLQRRRIGILVDAREARRDPPEALRAFACGEEETEHAT